MLRISEVDMREMKPLGGTMNKEQLISEILLLAPVAIDYHTKQHLLQLFPDKAIIETEMMLGVEAFASAHHCEITRKTFTYNQASTYWQGPEPQILRPHHMMMHMGGMGGVLLVCLPQRTLPLLQDALDCAPATGNNGGRHDRAGR